MKTLNKLSRFLGNEKARTQLLSAFVLALMVSTAFTGIFLMSSQVNAEHPSYTWDSGTLAVDTSSTLAVGSGLIKDSTGDYYLIYVVNDNDVYAKSRTTDANFTTSDSAVSIMDGVYKYGPSVYATSNGSVVVIEGNSAYKLLWTKHDAGGWSTPAYMGINCTNSPRIGGHTVEFDGKYWMSYGDGGTISAASWNTTDYPYASNVAVETVNSNTSNDDDHWYTDLVVYNGKLYCFYDYSTTGELWYKTKDSAAGSWSSATLVYDATEAHYLIFTELDEGNNVIFLQWTNGPSPEYSYFTYDGSTFSSLISKPGLGLGAFWVDNYIYMFNRTGSDQDINYFKASAAGSGTSYPSAPTGASATAYTNFDISLSGLDANSRITFPTATVDDTTGDIVWANETSYGVLTVSNDGIQQINLSWVKGSGATNTVIRYATSDPGTWTLSTGTALYNDTGTSYNHQNLDAGTHYYYALWSWNTSGYSETYVTCDAVAGNASVTNLTIHIEDVGSGTALVPKENFTLYGNVSGSYTPLGSFDAITGNVTLTTSYVGLPLAIGDKLYFEFKAVVGAGAQPSGTYYDNNAQTLDCYVKAIR